MFGFVGLMWVFVINSYFYEMKFLKRFCPASNCSGILRNNAVKRGLKYMRQRKDNIYVFEV
jgi:hypothetical protein